MKEEQKACSCAPPAPLRDSDTGYYPQPPLTPAWVGFAVSFAAVAAVLVVYFGFLWSSTEHDAWRADWERRTALCEAQGGIPRYQVRGRGYEGCDFRGGR